MRWQDSIINFLRVLFICAGPVMADPAEKHLAEATFIAFDTETTGLNPRKDRILELAAVKFRNGKLIEQRSWLINPGVSINTNATAIHGIDDAMVQGQPGFPAILPAFARFIDGAVLIGHNASFDINFINAEIARLKEPPVIPDHEIIDSLRLFRAWYPDLPSHKLSAIIAHFQLPEGHFHRALDDANMLAAAFLQALTEHTNKDTRLNRLYHDAGKTERFSPVKR